MKHMWNICRVCQSLDVINKEYTWMLYVNNVAKICTCIFVLLGIYTPQIFWPIAIISMDSGAKFKIPSVPIYAELISTPYQRNSLILQTYTLNFTLCNANNTLDDAVVKIKSTLWVRNNHCSESLLFIKKKNFDV